MKCPLCRADGEPLFVGYACTRPGCKNFVPLPKPPLGPRPEFLDMRTVGAAPIGSRAWAKHQHALGSKLAYRTTYMGSTSNWHTPYPKSCDSDPSWAGFDVGDPACSDKEPDLEIEWRLA